MIIAAATLAATLMTLAARFAGTYAVAWMIGAIGAVVIAARGHRAERGVLLGLALLSVFSGGEQTMIGLRTTIFAAQFMLLARYTTLDPYLHLFLQCLCLVIASLTGAVVEVFLFAPAVLPLVIAALTERAAREKNGRLGLADLFIVVGGSIASLAFAAVGYGSRSALFVWLASVLRRLSVPTIAAAVVILPVLLTLPGIPIVDKLRNSIVEVSEPIDQDTGTISQRGIETVIFTGWITEASAREVLFGSTQSLFEPGELIGHDEDVPFIPHNQILGLFFQFGVAGLLLVGSYFVWLWRCWRHSPVARFTLLILLPPCFLFKHGFIDADFALIASSLNWVATGGAARFVRPRRAYGAVPSAPAA